MAVYEPSVSATQRAAIAEVEQYAAHNYHPLPVVIESGEGAWVTDIDGRRYLDCLAAYSAVNFGHGNPALIKAAADQLGKITLTSRAFHAEVFGPYAKAVAELCGMDMMLPMNTGAEAVEAGLKLARKWGHLVKGVPQGESEIITMTHNFHGRTTTIVSFSSSEEARRDFGPFTPGFKTVEFGDADELELAITPNTVAVLLEPVQGEAGVIIPPEGYLARVREITLAHEVLMVADEIQTGMARTGTTFYCEQAGVTPDLYLLGKALGGGIVPASAVVGRKEILGLLRPGQHGSTFGGNCLAAAVGIAVVDLLRTGETQERSRVLGQRLGEGLRGLIGQGVTAVRQVGLWAGIDIDPDYGSGRQVCYRLLERGMLVKDTHQKTIRMAPPLVITADEVDFAVAQIAAALASAR